MSITLVISRGPASRASLRSAELARALLAAGEAVERVFFHGDGVLLCHEGMTTTGDPFGAAAMWQALMREYQLPSTACSGSLSRRAGSDEPLLVCGVEVAGLGQLAGALQDSQRVVSF